MADALGDVVVIPEQGGVVVTSNVERPIFIVGTGRSGSTVFHKVFARHPNVAWASYWLNAYPNRVYLNRAVMTLLDIPLLGRVFYRMGPFEVYSFWNYHYKGFGSTIRDLLPGDVTEDVKKSLPAALAKTLTRKRNRLLMKITGWPRVGFLYEIFEDAKFVHIYRDGRAVAYSFMNQPWWGGYRGPQNWRYGELPEEYQREWERYDYSFVALAGITWKILMDAMERAKKYVPPENFMEIKYEDLCQSPVETFREVVEFSELKWTKGFEDIVRRHLWRSANDKWKKGLTEEQKRILESVLKGHLKKYGYL